MAVSYSDAFKRQLKRLSRRYRHIRADVQPIIEQLEAGQTPGDQVRGLARISHQADPDSNNMCLKSTSSLRLGRLHDLTVCPIRFLAHSGFAARAIPLEP